MRQFTEKKRLLNRNQEKSILNHDLLCVHTLFGDQMPQKTLLYDWTIVKYLPSPRVEPCSQSCKSCRAGSRRSQQNWLSSLNDGL